MVSYITEDQINCNVLSVLILIVVEDGLVLVALLQLETESKLVLILIVVEDGLVRNLVNQVGEKVES